LIIKSRSKPSSLILSSLNLFNTIHISILTGREASKK
jgi:hypothetical protein